jgi:hypothetical protein
VKKRLLKLESSPNKERSLYQKGSADDSFKTPLKSENSQFFSFSISTNVFGEDFSRPPAGKIYFK